MTVASVGFLRDVFVVDQSIAILAFVVAMTAVAAWGVGESVAVVTIITIVEVGALLYVCGLNIGVLADLPSRATEFWPSSPDATWLGVFAGAFLSFYAFIGFEDMVNMAEEVKDVRRAMPAAILLSIVVATALYVIVIVIAVLALPTEQLVTSKTPVAELARDAGWMSGTGVWLVSLLTGINGALVQILMASRVAYGMATRGQAPQWFAAIGARTRTPLRATIFMGAVIGLFALFFPLTTLAKSTSAVILLIFAGVNFALWRVKGRDPDPDGAGPRYPRWLPLVGCGVSLGVLAFQAWLLL
jgi:amino acid transporter